LGSMQLKKSLKKNKKSSRISKKQLYICISQTNQLEGG
jgi:hypothetical protein